LGRGQPVKPPTNLFGVYHERQLHGYYSYQHNPGDSYFHDDGWIDLGSGVG